MGQAAAPGQPPGPAPSLRQGPGVQAAQDAREAAVLATCRNPPPANAGLPAGIRPSAAPVAPHDYTVTAIPGVIAAGQKWTLLWKQDGNNADGIIATNDGGILIAQNDSSDVLKLTADGKASVVYRNTHTGGALSRSKSGMLFIAERELNPAIWELSPQHQLLANRYQGDPLDCLGTVLNDLAADSKGGAYFTMGGLYYADARGTVTRYGEKLRTNGIILSPDEKILYVTNGDTLAAFEVQPNGSLINQRQLVTLPDGFGDGSTVDQEGRIYVTGGPAGVRVVTPDGRYLGTIPTPFGVISAAFSGPGKQTLFAVILTGGPGGAMRSAQIISIPMIARGYRGRAK